MPEVAERAPAAWKASHPTAVPDPDGPEFEPIGDGKAVSVDARKRTWARLLAKVYEVDPLLCPKCGCQMKIIAVIEDPVEIRRILSHLLKAGRAPPGFDPATLN